MARDWLDAHGYGSTIDYLAAMCRLVLDETGLLPHANAGALFPDELAQLRTVSASQGMMIETLRGGPGRPPGRPGQDPGPPAGHPRGGRPSSASPSPPGSWSASARTGPTGSTALEAIAASHARHGHVQEVIVQNFVPKPGTAMHRTPACPPDEFLDAIALARLHPAARRARPGPAEPLRRLRGAARRRHRRLGRRLPRHRRPRQPGAALAGARHACGPSPRPAGFELAPRLTIYPDVRGSPRSDGSTRACASR